MMLTGMRLVTTLGARNHSDVNIGGGTTLSEILSMQQCNNLKIHKIIKAENLRIPWFIKHYTVQKPVSRVY